MFVMFKVLSEGLSPEIDVLLRSPIQVQTKADVRPLLIVQSATKVYFTLLEMKEQISIHGLLPAYFDLPLNVVDNLQVVLIACVQTLSMYTFKLHVVNFIQVLNEGCRSIGAKVINI